MIGSYSERIQFLDSLYPKWNELSLWSCFSLAAARYPDEPYLIYQNQTFTYSQILDMAIHASKSLYILGVRPGDHVAVSLYNGPAFLCLIFALARLGAVKIPLNMKLSSSDKKYIIQHSDTNWLIGVQLSFVSDQAFPSLKGIYVLDCWEHFLSLGDSFDDSSVWENISPVSNPVSDILYTSGSTSFPKGVRLTHDTLLRTSYATCRTRLMEKGRRILVPLPFYHIFAYSEGILAAMHIGGSIVISDSKFDAANYTELMRRYQVNDIICVPLIAIKMLQQENIKSWDFPHLHAAFISPAGPDWLWQSFKDAFHISDVTTGYGMTECGATTTILSPLAPPQWIHHSVGGLKDAGTAGISPDFPHLLQIKIWDPDTGTELPDGQTGEIVCRGLTVTPGYYKNEEANLASFQKGGWFLTGDIGMLDKNKLLTFQGRKKDMYKINGENVSPQKLESIITKCPGVYQVEVVSIPHNEYGEIGIAFIDAGCPDHTAKQTIIEYCRQHLADFEVPRHFIFESQKNWPRTATNKVKKGELRERARQFLLSPKAY